MAEGNKIRRCVRRDGLRGSQGTSPDYVFKAYRAPQRDIMADDFVNARVGVFVLILSGWTAFVSMTRRDLAHTMGSVFRLNSRRQPV